MKNLRLVFWGSPSFINPVIEVLKNNFNLIKVINSQTPDSEIEELKTQAIDLFIVAAYGKIIPNELLLLPIHGALNIHPSLLPKYRGASPIQAAIFNGDAVSGISIIKMDEQMDHGPLIYQEEFQLSSNDTFEKLSNSMFQRSSEFLPKVITDYIEQKITPIPQDESKASYTWKTKETKNKAYFDIDNPPTIVELDRMARAFYPEPGCYTRWNGKVVKFLPGGLVQMEGKRATQFKDFINGYPNFPIKQLLKPE